MDIVTQTFTGPSVKWIAVGVRCDSELKQGPGDSLEAQDGEGDGRENTWVCPRLIPVDV